tara:strand:+ start:1923 stop:2852 length:930 start_codon:yes stop_codon:yes gene_type:complete
VVGEKPSYYTYATVSEFRDYLAGTGYSSGWTSDASVLRRMLHAVSKLMESYCQYNTWGPMTLGLNLDIGFGNLVNDTRNIYPSVSPFLTTGARRAEIIFPYWCNSITSITAYSGTSRTSSEVWAAGLSNDYLTVPYNSEPFLGFKQSTESTKSLNSGQQTLVVQGTFGWEDRSSIELTGTSEALDATETDVDVSSAANCSDGMVIKVQSELMYVQSIAGNTLTVIRGVSGSTKATHTSGQSVTRQMFPDDVVQTCLEITRVRYRERDMGLNRDIGSVEDRMTIPTKEEQLIMQDINHYKNYTKGSGVFF